MSQPQNVIGIDIGGTKILAGRFEISDLSRPTQTEKINTEAQRGHETVLKNLITVIQKLKNEQTKSIGVAWAGFVDSKTGIIKRSPNLPGFEGFAITKFLSEKTGCPVYLENDAKLFALAEQQCHYPDKNLILGIILGTGVGAGIINDGKILTGQQNFAGEIGHQIIVNQSDQTESKVQKLLAGPALEAYLGEPLPQVTAEYHKNEAYAETIRTKMKPRIKEMARFCYNLALTLNPDMIVLGGGAGKNFWPLFLNDIHREMDRKITQSQTPLRVQISTSTIENSGLIGAANLAHNT